MKLLAVLDGAMAYLRSQNSGSHWGGPFNGQKCRQAIFDDLLERFSFSGAIETGTNRGTTTDYLANRGMQVISIEINDFFYGYARCRFLLKPRVKLYRGDSKTVLTSILDRKLSLNKICFCYLDAHWLAILPLEDELRIIFERVCKAVVMVDDFQVPDDPGYGFDDYGPGQILNLDYLSDVIDKFDLSIFFPVCRSDEETGAKRGCVVLARGSEADGLRRIATLREHSS